MSEDSRLGLPLIVPVGHYLGAQVLAPGADVDHHVVRVGWELYQLEPNEEFAIWALGHGLPGPTNGGAASWTRSALIGAARAARIPNIDATLTDLIDRDLLIEVTPGTAKAVEFAQVCRTRSLLIGIGNAPDEPSRFEIGVAEDAPTGAVPGFAYELWKWGHAYDSLWHACHAFAAGREASVHSDPEQMLGQCLAAIQLLLVNGAIYLDEALDDPPASR
jgi:hypothetical protein